MFNYDPMTMMKNMMINREYCTRHASRALKAFKASSRLQPFIFDKTMILPESTNAHCFQIKMPVGTRVLIVSFSIAPDHMGNRIQYGEINADKPPSTMEILLLDVFDDYYETLGYNDDIRSFHWKQSFSDDGFEKIIDEFIRIRNIINGPVENTSAK
jgi:hypothetical protein